MSGSTEGRDSARVRRGFSMPELLTVVVIIGLVSAMAVPKFITVTGESQLDGDANSLFLEMEWAKLAANRAGVRHYLLFDTAASPQTWTIYRETNGNVRYDAGLETAVKRGALGTSVRLGHNGFSGISLPTFSPDSAAAVPSGGLARGYTDDDCVNDPLSPSIVGHANWRNGIAFCGKATADVESGALYLSTTRSKKVLYAIVFNYNKSLDLQRYRWSDGSGWAKL